MGLLDMNQQEYDYYVNSIAEAFALRGQDALLYQVSAQTKDANFDDTFTRETAVSIGCIFEDNPKPILKKMGWLAEDEELPYVCNLVAKDNAGNSVVVREGMVLEIHSKYGLISEQKFQVVAVRGNTIDPFYWICKLAPYRNQVDFIPETEVVDKEIVPQVDTGFSYLKR